MSLPPPLLSVLSLELAIRSESDIDIRSDAANLANDGSLHHEAPRVSPLPALPPTPPDGSLQSSMEDDGPLSIHVETNYEIFSFARHGIRS